MKLKTKQLDTLPVRLLMFVAFTGLSYGFISLALDSAHTYEYLLGILFLVWAVKSLIMSVRLALKRV